MQARRSFRTRYRCNLLEQKVFRSAHELLASRGYLHLEGRLIARRRCEGLRINDLPFARRSRRRAVNADRLAVVVVVVVDAVDPARSPFDRRIKISISSPSPAEGVARSAAHSRNPILRYRRGNTYSSLNTSVAHRLARVYQSRVINDPRLCTVRCLLMRHRCNFYPSHYVVFFLFFFFIIGHRQRRRYRGN